MQVKGIWIISTFRKFQKINANAPLRSLWIRLAIKVTHENDSVNEPPLNLNRNSIVYLQTWKGENFGMSMAMMNQSNWSVQYGNHLKP